MATTFPDAIGELPSQAKSKIAEYIIAPARDLRDKEADLLAEAFVQTTYSAPGRAGIWDMLTLGDHQRFVPAERTHRTPDMIREFIAERHWGVVVPFVLATVPDSDIV